MHSPPTDYAYRTNQLVSVANKPSIQYIVEELKDAGITDIGVVLDNKGCEAIWDRLGDGSACSVG